MESTDPTSDDAAKINTYSTCTLRTIRKLSAHHSYLSISCFRLATMKHPYDLIDDLILGRPFPVTNLVRGKYEREITVCHCEQLFWRDVIAIQIFVVSKLNRAE